jgi:hypothetical protein
MNMTVQIMRLPHGADLPLPAYHHRTRQMGGDPDRHCDRAAGGH